MGACLSKKNSSSPSSPSLVTPPPPPLTDLTSNTNLVVEEQELKKPEECGVKKEIFIIKQRKSHERPRPSSSEQNPPITSPIKLESSSPSPSIVIRNTCNVTTAAAPVRTSSCTKEEVDAILIQCGRLSRSSSGKASGDRKYSGSKRSYDFDHESNGVNNDDEYDNNYQHHSRPSHRRTPSREKEVAIEHKRSGSRERSEERRNKSSGGGSGSRRVSKSPGRRSDTPSAASSANPNAAPGKMVAVPARDKTPIGESTGTTTTGIKRVSVKRNGEIGGGARTAASPRSQSPANPTRPSNENAQQASSLSRNSSRKAEHSRSPYRRNPMAEIDDNCLKSDTLKPQDQINKSIGGINNKMHKTKKKPEERQNKPVQDMNKIAGENQQEQIVVDPVQVKGVSSKTNEVTVSTGAENLKPQTITRSRSSRRSRDLDINLGVNPDTLLNPNSYASLLLEDIQNFHQQNTTAFSLPPCVTKACSILDAVADLNSSTTPTISAAPSEPETERSKNNDKKVEDKDPVMESEVFVNDDLMEPSLHKYITVRNRKEETEQQESSGSNSILGHTWVSSTWEPNSADSTDRWTSMEEELYEASGARKLRSGASNSQLVPNGRKRELDQHHKIGATSRGGGGGGHISTTTPIAAAAAASL